MHLHIRPNSSHLHREQPLTLTPDPAPPPPRRRPAAADAFAPAARDAELEQQDIRVYCRGYVASALLALAVEGFILRLITLAAIYVCPRGLTLEPVVVAAGSAASRCGGWCRRGARRRTVTATGAAVAPGPSKV
jgi:hypothetical protein